MNLATLIVLLIVVAIVAAIVFFQIKKRKSGGGCSCGCEGCSVNCGAAEKKNK